MHGHCDQIGQLIIETGTPVDDRLSAEVERFLWLLNETLDAGALNYEQAIELQARILDVDARLTVELEKSLSDGAQSAQAGSAS